MFNNIQLIKDKNFIMDINEPYIRFPKKIIDKILD